MLNKKRMAAASSLLREKNIDALVVAVSMDTLYLSGLYMKPDERFKGIVLIPGEKNGNNGFAFVPALYKHEFEEAVSDIPFYFWKDEDWFYDSMKKGLDDFGVPKGGKVAFNDSVLAIEAIEFSKRWGYQLENGADIFSSLRLIKDAEETGYLKKAGEITDAALYDVFKYIKPGMTERQVRDYLFEKFAQHGADAATSTDPWGIIAKSENAAVPHYSKMDCEIKAGDSLLMDVGCTYNNYHSDVTRTLFIGEPDEERRKVYEIVREAQQAGIDIIRPGIKACDVDKVVRDVVEKAGYGPQFFHRTGHGIGLAIHEDPYISSSHQNILKEGMAFSVEPGIYLSGKFGVRIEDIVVVTANGCKTMTVFPKELTVV